MADPRAFASSLVGRYQTSAVKRLIALSGLLLLAAGGAHYAVVHGARTAQMAPPASLASDSRIKGIEPSAEGRILRALLKSRVASRIAKVGVGGNGFIQVAVVKFLTGAAGNRQVNRFATARIAEAIVFRTFQAEAKLQEVDVFGVLPWSSYGRGDQDPVVFSAIVTRQQLQTWLNDPRREASSTSKTLIDGVPNVYWNRYLVDQPGECQAASRVEEKAQLRSWLRRPAYAENGRTDPSLLPIVVRGSVRKPLVALTFDDGPHPVFTPLLLDTLARYHVKATFFVVGMQAAQFQDLTVRIHANGHELGNHTYSHTRLTDMPLPAAMRELKTTQRILADLTGEWVRWYRPPGGECNASIVSAAKDAGFIPVLWTNNTADFAGPPVASIVQRAVRHLTNGSIILLHCDNIKTVEALPTIIKTIRAQGFDFGTVYDLVWEYGPEFVAASRIPRLTNIRPQPPRKVAVRVG